MSKRLNEMRIIINSEKVLSVTEIVRPPSPLSSKNRRSPMSIHILEVISEDEEVPEFTPQFNTKKREILKVEDIEMKEIRRWGQSPNSRCLCHK
jgi:hypothetical protein